MKSTHRIGLLLTLVFLLPALFFSVYELSSLDKDEKMIQDIYGKQLEAILFSANQYADDVISSWATRIETALDNTSSTDSIPAKINDLLYLNSALTGIFLIDTIQEGPSLRIFSVEKEKVQILQRTTEQALLAHQNTIQQLRAYKKSGFQKIERIELQEPELSGIHCLLFITQTSISNFKATGLFLDADLFIEDILGPRLQSIAKDQFILSVLLKDSSSVAYSTYTSQDGEQQVEALTKEFWILPEYTLGIQTKGTTLQQLVRERTRTNMYLLIGLDVILIIAVILVFRNLKKEVNLAQNKAHFVSNVSHEIRTPLALISMFAETLEMNRVPSEEKRRAYYSIISKETQRLTGIVNKILNFSQADANKKVLHPESLHVDTVIRSVLDTYDFHLRNKGFEYSYAGQDDLYILADREALVEAFINLIDNAMKYSSEKKNIEISAKKENKYGFIRVKDEGVGITAYHQKHIFDKFYRVPSGNLARSRGTGLGLSLVKQLMESQKGKITVTSEPGKGSEFTLYFPLE
jgi:two-component system, OmpR family, phosphate regulon sensor histidine kinase PhoR